MSLFHVNTEIFKIKLRTVLMKTCSLCKSVNFLNNATP